ncbi:MAG: hypothetical protein HY903_11400 [Deltaproteobacteria bacterium]|nr:hypothetical protein [Deltaproteobacteria bacterium]
MYRRDRNDTSPLRILERSIHGGLGAGNLGVVMARAGLGKTAFLIQLALDEATRDRGVLHLALGQTLEHMLGWYETLFEDLLQTILPDNPYEVRATVGRRRIIQALPERKLDPERLGRVIDLYGGSIAFRPAAILIDGFDWSEREAATHAAVKGFKAIAKELHAELWMSAQTHREVTSDHPQELTPPCAAFADLIDVALFLEPQGGHVSLRLLKDHDNETVTDTHLELDPVLLRLMDEKDHAAHRLPAHAYSLLSAGSSGAEAEFGAAAERWGIAERNFSYAGRKDLARAVAAVELSPAQLAEGAVSIAYAETHLGRKLSRTEELRRTLQLVWHEVVTAEQVFVVDAVQGGKPESERGGWAAELARRFCKPLGLFDQAGNRWLTWGDGALVETEAPRVTKPRFCGTGAASLTETGKAAIHKLFAESFGPRT